MDAILRVLEAIAETPFGQGLIHAAEGWLVEQVQQRVALIESELGKGLDARLGAIAERFGLPRLSAALGVLQNAVNAAVTSPTPPDELGELRRKGLVSVAAMRAMAGLSREQINAAFGLPVDAA